MMGCYIIEPENKEILGISISKERKNMFVVAEHFLSDVVVDYGPYPVSTVVVHSILTKPVDS
jgi:hypothetical protein